jgi:DNA-binding NarL/FixJ family response regulator
MKQAVWVEDDIHRSAAFHLALIRNDYDVINLQTASEAVSYFERGGSYDVVIIDMLLPTGEDRDSGTRKEVGIKLLNELFEKRLILIEKCFVLSILGDEALKFELITIGVNGNHIMTKDADVDIFIATINT